jgi:hypothetical protein
VFTFQRLVRGTLFVLFLFTTVLAQENRAPIAKEPSAPIPTAPLVTATAAADRVRFVSPGSVVQLRLEVYNETGQKIFDTELRGGNVLDWHLQDGAGQRLPTGSYACVLTSKSLSGRLSQRVGWMTVNEKNVAIEARAVSQLSLAQQQTIGPVEGDAAFAVLHENEVEAITTITHDGAEGQVARTNGALTFRLGDIFSGKDKEQMRLTEEGRLGIGTNDPQANLDVAGTIRAERVLIAKPGRPGNKPAGDTAQGMDAEGSPQPLASGSGTQNRIAKWIDNIGTLGDSGITETSTGLVGIGNTTPQSLLHVGENAGYGSTTGLLITNNLNGGQYNRAFQLAPRQTANPVTNSIMMYALPTVNAGVTVPGQFGIAVGGKLGQGSITSYAAFATNPMNLGATNNTHLLIGSPGIPPGNFAIFDNTGYTSFFRGNVGIGTSAPQARLDVRGDIKLGRGGELFAPGGDENLRIVRGVISSDGVIVEGSGFQVTHNDRGHYIITFDTVFAGAPAVTATSEMPGETDSPTIIAVQTPSAGNVILRQYCQDPKVCGDIDAPFHFIAVGPR